MSFTRHFPDEVLLLIIHHTIPLEARYHNLPDHLSTLHSLSLTSKAVRSLTRNVLYQDLLISSPAQAQHFLTTVAKPAKLDLVRRTTKTIRFGPQEEQEDDVTGDFAAEVLAVVSVSQLEEVAFRWISLGAAAMWTLSNLCSLELWFVTVGRDVRLHLPALTKLKLGHAWIDEDAHQDVLKREGLPSLTYLGIYCHKYGVPPAVLADRHAAIMALAPQLESLDLEEHSTWLDPVQPGLWAAFTKLRLLEVDEPYVKDDEQGVLTYFALADLPNSLRTLDVWTRPCSFAVVARNLRVAFETGRPSVSGLKQLVLPPESHFDEEEGLNAWFQQLALRELTVLAEARGVLVTTARLETTC